MKKALLISCILVGFTGCHQESPKLSRQKEIYFSLSDVPKQELEKEIHRTMVAQHFNTEGKAMIYLINQSISELPKIEATVNQAAAQAGFTLPKSDPLDDAETKIKLARELQTMLRARKEIGKLESEVIE
jgi:predicted nucleic acid-binding protein